MTAIPPYPARRNPAGQASDALRPVLSIIIPAYNEVQTIGEVLERVRNVPINKEIIVVNDGSSDGTGELLERERDKDDIIVVTLASNQGKGAAVRIGLERAQGEIIAIQDADLELDPSELPQLIKPIQDGHTEVVYGSRFSAQDRRGRVPRPSLTAWFGNKVLTMMTNLLYGSRLTDMETCYKVCRASVIKGIQLESVGFELEPELTAKLLRLGFRIHEVPISYQPRTRVAGKKIGWKDGVKAIYCLIKYRFQDVRTFIREPDAHAR